MGIIFRKSIKLGPVRLNLSRRGVSTSVKAGPVSVNSRSRRVRVNLPGPLSWWSRPLGYRAREAAALRTELRSQTTTDQFSASD